LAYKKPVDLLSLQNRKKRDAAKRAGLQTHGERYGKGHYYCEGCRCLVALDHDHAAELLEDERTTAPADRPLSRYDRNRIEMAASKGLIDLPANVFLDRLARAEAPRELTIVPYEGPRGHRLAQYLAWPRATYDGTRQGYVAWILSNPTPGLRSTVVRRVVSMSRWWGYSEALIVYLWSLIDPETASLRRLITSGVPGCAEGCDDAIALAVDHSALSVAAWGVLGPLAEARAKRVLVGPCAGRSLWCLGFQSRTSPTPKAPLQVAEDARLVPYPELWALQHFRGRLDRR
jgi:hypothetical protein